VMAVRVETIGLDTNRRPGIGASPLLLHEHAPAQAQCLFYITGRGSDIDCKPRLLHRSARPV